MAGDDDDLRPNNHEDKNSHYYLIS